MRIGEILLEDDKNSSEIRLEPPKDDWPALIIYMGGLLLHYPDIFWKNFRGDHID